MCLLRVMTKGGRIIRFTLPFFVSSTSIRLKYSKIEERRLPCYIKKTRKK